MELSVGSVIDDFANNTITVLQKKTAKRVAGDLIDGGTDRVTIKEPLIPNTNQIQSSYFNSGQVDLYDATWYSHHDEFNVKDEVIDDSDSTKYTIENKTNYKNYADVVIYGLKAVKS